MPLGVEQVAHVAAAPGAEGHGRVGRAEGGRADLRDRQAARLRDDAQRVDVGRLALVGRHAGGGVALDVLDRGVALADRQQQVGGGDVVLVVDEVLALVADRLVARHGPQPARRQEAVVGRLGRRARLGVGKAGGLGGGSPGGEAVLQAALEPPGALAAAGRTLALHRLVGHEARRLLVVAQLAAGLAEQVHRRVPAARGGDEVAGDLLGAAGQALAVVRHRLRLERAHALGALDRRDAVVGEDADAGGARLLGERAGGFRAQIDRRGDLDARVLQVERGLVGAVVVGHQDAAIARLDAEAVDVAARRACQQDAGAVVIDEHQRPLDRAGRQHDLLRAHLPHPLARPVGRFLAQVVGAALQQVDPVVVVIAEHDRARQDPHLGMLAQLLERRLHPVDRRLTIDRLARGQ